MFTPKQSKRGQCQCRSSSTSEFFWPPGAWKKRIADAFVVVVCAVLLDTLAPLRKQIANLEKEFPAIQENWIVIAR